MAAAFTLGLALPAYAQETKRGTVLHAASNFGQGWRPEIEKAARDLAVPGFRDAVYWSRAEKNGRFRFSDVRETWPSRHADGVSLTLNWGHPRYDRGKTPHSGPAVEAFARFAAALVLEFPAVERIEVGNEFNADNFVDGPVASTGPADRAEAHLALLAATSRAVRSADGRTIVLGGGAHSLPLAYLWALLDRGGRKHMDALAFHPYDTPPEALEAQVDVFARHPAALDLPLEVTEFGTVDKAEAPDHLLRSVCAMTLAGVRRAVWYPLGPRDDGYAPLVTEAGATETGQTFSRLVERFSGQPVKPLGDGSLVRGCHAPRLIVLWGAGGRVCFETHDVRVARGEIAGGCATLSDAPVVVETDRPLTYGRDFRIHPSSVLADTRYQFAYPSELVTDEKRELLAPGPSRADPFERLITVRGRERPLVTLPGQERPGAPWVPYLGDPSHRPLRVLSNDMALSDGAGVVHRMRDPVDGTSTLSLEIDLNEGSRDGVLLTVREGNELLLEKTVTTAISRELTLQGTGRLSVQIDPGPSAVGDLMSYRFRVERDATSQDGVRRP